MKKIYSLKGKGHYQEVFKKGKRFNGEGVQLIVLRLKSNVASSTRAGGPESGDCPIRIGISIGARYGGARERNTAKRRIRAICREMLPSMVEGYYLVLRPSGAFAGLEYRRAQDSMRQLFRMSGVLKR